MGLDFGFRGVTLGYDTPESHVLVDFFIDSPGYDTPGRLTRRVIIPQEDWLTGVSVSGEMEKFE